MRVTSDFFAPPCRDIATTYESPSGHFPENRGMILGTCGLASAPPFAIVTLTIRGDSTMVAIFVLVSILLFVLIDLILQRTQRRKEALAPQSIRPPVADRFLIPRGYFLSRGHSWIELMFSGNARVGIDDFVQKLVGPVESLQSVPLHAEVRKGDPLFTMVSRGRSLSIPSPLSGTVVEVNADLLRQPSVLNSDPYVSGWGVIIRPTRLASELRLFSIAEGAATWLKGEVSRFRDFIKDSASRMTSAPLPAGATLLDGGTPVSGVLQMTDEKTWEDFQQEFLSL